MAKDPWEKRSNSVDSREEQNRADVRIPQCTWSPQLEVDVIAIPWNALVRDFQRGRAGYIVEALEQNDLFLSLKRDLAMVSNLSYP